MKKILSRNILSGFFVLLFNSGFCIENPQRSFTIIDTIIDCEKVYTISSISDLNVENNSSFIEAKYISTSGNIRLAQGLNIVIKGKEEIRLKPGFVASKGINANFYIGNVNCNKSNIVNKISNDESSLKNGSNLTVFPNPTSGVFFVKVSLQSKNNKPILISIITSQGQVIVRNYVLPFTQTKFNLSNYAKGFYLVQALAVDGEVYGAEKVILN